MNDFGVNGFGVTHRPGRVLLVALAAAAGLAGCRAYRDARLDDLGQVFRGGVGFSVGLYAEVEATSLIEPAVGFADASLTPKLAAHWDPRTPPTSGSLRTAAFPTLLVGWPVYGHGEHAQGYGDTRPYLRGFIAPFILMGNHHVEGRTTGLLHLDSCIANPRIDPEPHSTDSAPTTGPAANGPAANGPDANGPDATDEESTPGEADVESNEVSAVQEHGWFGVSATIGLVRVDLGVNPIELLDFILGLFQPN